LLRRLTTLGQMRGHGFDGQRTIVQFGLRHTALPKIRVLAANSQTFAAIFTLLR
jgi:hypothetical protein